MIATFLFALITSFWGSIPPGPSNLAVMHTVLNKNSKAGFWMALGACLPEIPYTYLAVMAVQYVSSFNSINIFFEIVTALLLLSVGINATFFQKSKDVNLEEQSEIEKKHIHPFLKGIAIGSLNPMIFGFWLVTAEVASKTGWLNIQSVPEKISFVAGAAAGALALLFLIVVFTHKIKQKMTPTITTYLNKGIGFTFILLGLVQAFKFYIHYF